MFVRATLVAFCLGVLPIQGTLADDDWSSSLFTEKGIDFGALPRGAIVRHNFVLQNRTSELLNILDVRASCGCTSGRALSTSVQPGQSTIIEAQLDTRNFVGIKNTKLIISLLTAGGKQAEVSLEVHSNILSDIVLNPGAIRFGVLAKGQAAEQLLTIDRRGSNEWRIERLLASRKLASFIDASLTESYRNGEGVGYVLKVAVKPDAPSGAMREEIRLVTNDRETPIVTVLVNLEIRGSLSASPSVLSLGRASTSAGPVQGRILVRANAPFTIKALEGAGEGFQIEADMTNEKPLHIVTVSFHPEQTLARGGLRRTFRIQTSLPNEQPLEVGAVVQALP